MNWGEHTARSTSPSNLPRHLLTFEKRRALFRQRHLFPVLKFQMGRYYKGWCNLRLFLPVALFPQIMFPFFFKFISKKFALIIQAQIARARSAPLAFHLVFHLRFNLGKHLFWDGLVPRDSFGPGIAHITAILNLTKPDWSKRAFGLAEIGYSSSSISSGPGLDGSKGNYSCSVAELVKIRLEKGKNNAFKCYQGLYH